MSGPISRRREFIGLDRIDWFLLLGTVLIFGLIIMLSFWNDPVRRVSPPTTTSEELIHVRIPSATPTPTVHA